MQAIPKNGFFPPRIDVVEITTFFLPLNCTTSKSRGRNERLMMTLVLTESYLWPGIPAYGAPIRTCKLQYFRYSLYSISSSYFPFGRPSLNLPTFSILRQSFLKFGKAAVRIHTIRSSFCRPLFLGSRGSKSQRSFFQSFGLAKPLNSEDIKICVIVIIASNYKKKCPILQRIGFKIAIP